jgi:hypothetical protein
VIAGDAVLQAVWSAGVVGDVPTDGANALTSRIRCKEIAATRQRVRQVKVHDARLNDRIAIDFINFVNARHASRDDEHPAPRGNRASSQAGASATSNDRQAIRQRQPDYCGNLFSRTWQDGHERQVMARNRFVRSIEFINRKAGGISGDVARTHDRREPADQFCLPCQVLVQRHVLLPR